MGFSVIWIKHFEKPLPLPAKEYNRGGINTYTIYHETNEKFIAKIKEIMKYNYKSEV